MFHITTFDGEKFEFSGNGMQPKQKPARFELVLPNRDKNGDIIIGKKTRYRGNNSAAMATVLEKHTLTKKNK